MNPFKAESKTQPNRLTVVTNSTAKAIKRKLSAHVIEAGSNRRTIEAHHERRRLQAELDNFDIISI